ncbi:MAG: HAMP domain-containing protein [Oscillospiraceae bacterium]|nr:HAMP domain-containing protein [Oscillospiraceae bacterium]
MKIKVSLLFKQTVLIIIIMGIGAAVIANLISRDFENMYVREMIFAMRKTIHRFTAWVNTSMAQGIPNDCGNCKPGYYDCCFNHRFAFRITETDLNIIYANTANDTYFIKEPYYTIIYRRDTDNETWVLWAGAYSYEDAPSHGTPIENHVSPYLLKYYNALSLDNNGIFIGLDGEGERVGLAMVGYTECGVLFLLETGLPHEVFKNEIREIKIRTYIYVAAVTGAVILVSLLGLWFSVRYLKKLKTAVEKVKEGDYSIKIPVKGHDEITQIAESFNAMSVKIDSHTRKLTELNEAYHRFLPEEIIQKLGHENAVSVQSGDNTLTDVYILYVLVNGFAESIDNTPADEAFMIFNRLCSTVMEMVGTQGGLIESSDQSGFICFFEQQKNAHQAAFSLRKELRRLEFKSLLNIETTLAVIKGEILIGITGSETRLCTFAVSQDIKLSKIFAETGAVYGAGVICAENASDTFYKRYLGSYKTTRLFDCYEGESEDVFFSKGNSRELFERGVKHFEDSDYPTAKRVFIECLKLPVPDMAAKQYLFLSEHNIRNPCDRKGFERPISPLTFKGHCCKTLYSSGFLLSPRRLSKAIVDDFSNS